MIKELVFEAYGLPTQSQVLIYEDAENSQDMHTIGDITPNVCLNLFLLLILKQRIFVFDKEMLNSSSELLHLTIPEEAKLKSTRVPGFFVTSISPFFC